MKYCSGSLTKMSAAMTPLPNSRFQRVCIQLENEDCGTMSPPYTNSSSSTNGTARSSEKGQPTIAPVAKRTVAARVRRVRDEDGGTNENEQAAIVVCMANVEGKNADEGRV
jgi:hypothetical protein